MIVALLPLDDRPYNLAFVRKVATLAGIETLVPAPADVGHFFSPGKPEKLADWLLGLPADVDALIVALDMLACGGLLASRSGEITVDSSIENLAVLERLREERPDIKILAFDTIIRTSLSARDTESRRIHRLLHRYSTLVEKVEVVADEATVREFQEVVGAIPPESIERYREVRRRKHAVNRHALELAGAGVIDILHLLMEDVGPEGDKYGVHKSEQVALRRRGRELNLEDRLFLHNGTDEGALTLLAHLINDIRDSAPSIYVRYSAVDGASQVATFEDRSIGENIASLVAAVGGVLTDDLPSADAVLAVHTPYGEPPDIDGFVTLIEHDLARERPLCLIDTNTNAADALLMSSLSRRVALDELTAYAAWNTACNSLGTGLSQLCARLLRCDDRSEVLNRLLVIERLLDDYVYESLVRPEVNQSLEESGLNPWDLGCDVSSVTELVAEKMKEVADERLSPFVRTDFRFAVTLPWPRTFEPSIEVWPGDQGSDA
ncbi:MAG: DUF4127 family protein [Trueperaceae bacterium]